MNKKIDNNLKNTKRTSSSNPDSTNRNINTNNKNIDNNLKNRKSPSASSKPIRVPRIQRDRNYIILVWQSKTNGVIRRVMEVPGTELNRTLTTIRDQRKAFDYYLKR